MTSERLSDYRRGMRDGCFLMIQELLRAPFPGEEGRIAEDLAMAAGFTRSELLRLSKRSGISCRVVNRRIRQMKNIDE